MYIERAIAERVFGAKEVGIRISNGYSDLVETVEDMGADN